MPPAVGLPGAVEGSSRLHAAAAQHALEQFWHHQHHMQLFLHAAACRRMVPQTQRSAASSRQVSDRGRCTVTRHEHDCSLTRSSCMPRLRQPGTRRQVCGCQSCQSRPQDSTSAAHPQHHAAHAGAQQPHHKLRFRRMRKKRLTDSPPRTACNVATMHLLLSPLLAC